VVEQLMIENGGICWLISSARCVAAEVSASLPEQALNQSWVIKVTSPFPGSAASFGDSLPWLLPSSQPLTWQIRIARAAEIIQLGAEQQQLAPAQGRGLQATGQCRIRRKNQGWRSRISL